MVKKYFLIIIISLIMCFLVQGCASNQEGIKTNMINKMQVDSMETVISPENNILPIEGTWEITNYLDLKDSSSKDEEDEENREYKELINKTAVFSKEYAFIYKDICYEPQYKVKSIKTSTYLYHSMKKSKQEVNVDSEYVDVISISSEENYFYDIIKVDENNILIKINDILYYLKKISPNIEKYIYGSAIEKPKGREIRQNNSISSGVLFGLKYKTNKESREYEYNTLWISHDNGEIGPIIELPKLLVPRIAGFQLVDIIKDQGYDGQYISIKNIDLLDNTPVKEIPNISIIGEKQFLEINFVGEDYIATQNIREGSYGGTKDVSIKYEVKSLDDISNSEPIAISSIFGKKSRNSFEDMAKEEVFKINSKVAQLNFDETNYTIIRDSGHWRVEGIINATNKDGTKVSKTLGLNLDPELKMVNYDELYIPWSQIKEAIPSTVDAFISPSKDFAIIKTKSNLQLHRIINNSISSNPLNTIDLPEGTSIVMAEWAQGGYSDKWYNICRNIENNLIMGR
ncbi:MAG: hypothetical protein RSB70_00275 [Clostridium sp.]